MQHGLAPIHLAGASLDADAHICALFRNDADERAVLDPFMAETIASGERLVVIVDPAERGSLDRKLQAAGLEVAGLVGSGQLVLLDWTQAYLPGGRFDHTVVLDLFRSVLADSLRLGYPRVRVIGRMDWVLAGPAGVETLLEYERQATKLIGELGHAAVCVYRTDRFDPRILATVAPAHRGAVLGTTFQQNPFFPFHVPADDFPAT